MTVLRMTDLDLDGSVGPRDDEAVLGRLSTLDRFLPLWIALAMIGGVLLVVALTQKPGGYRFADIPHAVTRVIAGIIQ